MDSFNPTIRCPYCDGVNRPSVTGWGRTGLNNRQHICKYCNKEYVVVVYVESSSNTYISDGRLSSLKSKIRYLKKRIVEMEQNLVTKEQALVDEFIRVERSTCGKQN